MMNWAIALTTRTRFRARSEAEGTIIITGKRSVNSYITKRKSCYSGRQKAAQHRPMTKPITASSIMYCDLMISERFHP
jgi:hypothetical protein